MFKDLTVLPAVAIRKARSAFEMKEQDAPALSCNYARENSTFVPRPSNSSSSSLGSSISSMLLVNFLDLDYLIICCQLAQRIESVEEVYVFAQPQYGSFSSRESLVDEVMILGKLRHPCITTIIGAGDSYAYNLFITLSCL